MSAFIQGDSLVAIVIIIFLSIPLVLLSRHVGQSSEREMAAMEKGEIWERSKRKWQTEKPNREQIITGRVPQMFRSR